MDIMLRDALRKYNGLRAQLDRNLLGDDGEEWERQLKKFLRKEPTWVAPAASPLATNKPTLVLLKAVELGEVASKDTQQCMTGTHWCYRDSDIDRWLLKEQPAVEAAPVGVYQLQKPAGTTFREMAQAALGTAREWSKDELATLLKKRGLILTLPAVELMVERQEAGEDVGLGTDGYANIAFLEDAEGFVSVLVVHRNGRQWVAYVYRLGHGSRWGAGSRLLLRNSVTATL